MIDYVKILLKNPNIKKLKQNLDFKLLVSEKNGDCSSKTVAHYRFCKITIYNSGIVYFDGSIHKMWNSLNNILAPNYNSKNYKGYNGNQYILQDILNTKKHLCKLLFCEPQQLTFQNIEFGLNLTTIFNPQKFITGLLYHSGKAFESGHERHYKEVRHKKYRVKIYNKGVQYGMSSKTLRIEVACKKSIEFAETGIKTFENVNKHTLKKGLQLILKRFDEVVYYDNTINTKGLNKRQKTTLLNYQNMNYWFDTLKPNKRDSHKKNLQNFINQNSTNLHAQIRKKILQTRVIKDRLYKTQTRVIKDTLYKESDLTQNTTQNYGKKCTITGIDISMQKESSLLLSHTGLKHYLKNNKKVFDEVASLYLSNKWVNDSTTIQIKEIAHNIRNKHNNRILKQSRLYPTQQTQLF